MLFIQQHSRMVVIMFGKPHAGKISEPGVIQKDLDYGNVSVLLCNKHAESVSSLLISLH